MTAKLAASVIIDYQHLLSGKNLQPLIQQAYGPQGTSNIIQDMESFLSTESRTTQNRERRPFRSSTDSPISPNKLFRNMKDLRFIIPKVGHAELSNFKGNMTLQKGVTT